MTDLDRLQGAWKITSLDMGGGMAMGEAQLSGARIEIDGEAFTTTGMGATYRGRVELDEAEGLIRLCFSEGPEAGAVNGGRYAIEADGWRLCLNTRGAEPPADFAPGGGVVVETLERA